MPNWCHDELTVVGPPDAIAAFRDRLQYYGEGRIALLNSFLPYPKELASSTTSGEAWFVWYSDHWGCSGDSYTEFCLDRPNRLIFSFDSAWVPPVIGITRISELFPSLEFRLVWWEMFAESGGSMTLVVGTVTAGSSDCDLRDQHPTMSEF